MKLHKALQKIVSQFGTEVLQEERLVNLLADYKAFDDYPAMRQVMEALSEGGYVKDLLDPAISGKRAYTPRANRAKKSLAADRNFRQEFADYAVDCVSFATGRISSVTPPSDHGFDPSAPAAKGAPANSQGGSGQAPSSGQAPKGGSGSPSRKAPAKWLFTVIAAAIVAGAVLLSPNLRLPFLSAWFGDPDAQYELAAAYAAGDGVSKDPAEAAKWYQKAAEQGDMRSQSALGDAYAKGLGVELNYSEAVRWWRMAAGQGDVKSQMSLGNAYAKGIGVRKDPASAMQMFSKAAEKGDAGAQFALGSAYADGNGTEKDDAQALRWWHKAAEQGHVGAEAALGDAYAEGRGAAQDYAEAAEWWRRAAGQGDTKSLLSLGEAYAEGRGVEKDPARAVEMYSKAAENGDAGAQFALGRAYADGNGTEKDYQQALKWWRGGRQTWDMPARRPPLVMPMPQAMASVRMMPRLSGGGAGPPGMGTRNPWCPWEMPMPWAGE